MKTLVFILLLRYCSTYDLCSSDASKKLCRGGKHIACCSDKEQMSCINNPLQLAYDVGKAIYPMTSQFIDIILHRHNELRDSVACGDRNYTTVTGQKIPISSSMNEIIWSDELASVVRMNMKNCIYGHAKGFSSPNYPLAGQNIGYRSVTVDIREVAIDTITAWFEEYIFIPDINDLNKFNGKPYMKDEQIGHFTAMIRDSQTHVGCTMVKCRSSAKTVMMFGCNYSKTNMVGEPTYKFTRHGKPGEKCEKKSKKYKRLCAPS